LTVFLLIHTLSTANWDNECQKKFFIFFLFDKQVLASVFQALHTNVNHTPFLAIFPIHIPFHSPLTQNFKHIGHNMEMSYFKVSVKKAYREKKMGTFVAHPTDTLCSDEYTHITINNVVLATKLI
jgi:hypothetical protein